MLLAVHTTNTFLENRGSQLSPEVRTKLQEGGRALDQRYQGVQREGEWRAQHLTLGQEELGELEPDVKEFEEWLTGAERDVSRFYQSQGPDIQSLQTQV